jgi:hypothetical protein
MPQVDLNAVIGSFVGAMVFILWAKELSVLQRVGYLIAGWIGGYYASAEVFAQAWTKTSGIVAFGCGLVAVVLSISVLEAFSTGKLPKWLTELPAAIGKLRRGE